MKQIALITSLFSLVILAGGTAGYLFAGSVPSLVASSIFGTLLLISSLAMFKEKKWGMGFAFVLSLILGVFFMVRFVKQPAPMSVCMMTLSSAMAYYLFSNRALCCNKETSEQVR